MSSYFQHVQIVFISFLSLMYRHQLINQNTHGIRSIVSNRSVSALVCSSTCFFFFSKLSFDFLYSGLLRILCLYRRRSSSLVNLTIPNHLYFNGISNFVFFVNFLIFILSRGTRKRGLQSTF